MRVILTERVPTLGNVGEIVSVSPGHARNYLLPNRLAVVADEGNKRFIEDQKKRLAKKIQAQKDQAVALKGKIDGLSIELIKRIGDNGKLFGSVTSTELSAELAKRGVEVDRRQILVESPIKQLGTHEVKVKLFTDVYALFKVKVDLDEKQAEELKKRQAEAKKRAEEKKEQAALEAAGKAQAEEGSAEEQAE